MALCIIVALFMPTSLEGAKANSIQRLDQMSGVRWKAEDYDIVFGRYLYNRWVIM